MGAGSMMISHANDAYFWVDFQVLRARNENDAKSIFRSDCVDGMRNIACSLYFIINITPEVIPCMNNIIG